MTAAALHPEPRLPLAPVPNEVRIALAAEAPPPALAPFATRDVHISFTPHTPADPTRPSWLPEVMGWAVYAGVTPRQAMDKLVRRLCAFPSDLRARTDEAGDLLLYTTLPDRPLAIVTRGLSGGEARGALEAMMRDRRRG